MAVNMGTAIAYLELDTSKFTKGFASARNDLQQFNNSSASISTRMTGLSNAMVAVGSTLTKSVSVPLATIGAMALKTTADFDAGMSEVKAISGATGAEFKQLETKAIQMGAKTKYSATEAASAFKYMAMAGWDTSDMLSGISGVMNLAAASGEDLATTSDIVTDALTAFGLSAKDSSHFADILAQASSRSNTNVGLMGETFKYVAPVAGALGYSAEDCATAIGLMANSGIKASQAGTALRSLLTRLAKPTDTVAAAMKKYNITLTDANGNMKPLSTLMVEMRDRFSGLSEAQKANLAATLAGQEGMSGLLAIVNSSDEDFKNLTDSINNADGASDRMAKTMQDNLKGSITIFKSTVESAAISIGKKLTPEVRKFVDTGTSLVKKFNDMSDAEKTNIVNIGKMATVIPLATLAGGKLLGGLVNIGKGIVNFNAQASLLVQAIGLYRSGATSAALATGTWFSSLSSVGTGIMSFITNPAGAAVIGVAALTVALIANTREMENYKKAGSKMSEEEQLLIDRTKELKQAYDESNKSKLDAIKSANDESTAQQTLWEKLQGTVDANGRVLAGKEAYAQFVAGELSDSLGKEISIVDGQVQEYDKLKNTIQQVIEKKRAEAVQSAMQEQYGEALKKQSEATLLYNENLGKVMATKQKLKKAEAEATKALDDYTSHLELGTGKANPYYNAMLQAQGKVEGLNEKVKQQTKAIDDSREAMEGYNQTVANYEGLSSALIEGDAQKISDALLKVQNSFQTANTATRESLEEQAKTLNEKYEQMKQALADGATGVTEESVAQIKALSDQANKELEAKLEQDKNTLKTKFQQVGIEAPQSLIDSLASKSDTVQQTTMNILTNMANGVSIKKGELTTLFKQLGIDVPNSLVTQLASMSPSVQQQAVQLLMQLQNGEASQRPAVLQQMRDLGIKVDDSVASGIQGNTGKVKTESGKVGSAGHSEMQSKMNKTLKSPNVDSNTTSSASREASSAFSAMQSFFAGRSIGAKIKATIEAAKQAASGSHANGLDYVPYNGYIAELHKGERVLTKQENVRYNKGEGNASRNGDTFIFYNTQPDPYEYARQQKKAKRELLFGV
nr:MAG TPA: minor tail protein [Caudoviricetes sp.]